MLINLITTMVTILGGIIIAGTTYWFTKKQEREAELRKEKLEHYKDFVASLSDMFSNCKTPENRIKYTNACNKLMLIAPQSVIEAFLIFQQQSKLPNIDNETRLILISKLFYEIRLDLKINPSDSRNSFRIDFFDPSL